MRVWRRIMSCAVILAAVAAASVQGQAPREGGRTRTSPEERAKLAKEAAPLAAKAVAQHLKLSAEAEKKFTAAYVKESAEAQKRSAEARESDDRDKRREVFTQNREKMEAMLKANLTEEQVKKAATILGGFSSLDRTIQSLLQAKVEKAKVKKALPVLVKYTAGQREMFTKMRDGSISREDIGAKFTELREKTAKELAPIIGEKAATAWKEASGMRRGRRGAGGGGGGNR